MWLSSFYPKERRRGKTKEGAIVNLEINRQSVYYIFNVRTSSVSYISTVHTYLFNLQRISLGSFIHGLLPKPTLYKNIKYRTSVNGHQSFLIRTVWNYTMFTVQVPFHSPDNVLDRLVFVIVVDTKGFQNTLTLLFQHT